MMGRYRVILCDPPWSFEVWSQVNRIGRKSRTADAYYSTMSLEDLRSIPVDTLAADDCALFMWATWPQLPDALALGAAWGFKYKTLAFDWIKRSPNGGSWHTGLGFWTRANSEPCLFFTKGSPKRKSKSVKQVIADVGQQELFPPLIAPVSTHSAKPYEQYSRIEALLDGPYIELFSRVRYPEWTSIGYDIDGLDIKESIRRVLNGEITKNIRATYVHNPTQGNHQ